jgi:hypothetical protein
VASGKADEALRLAEKVGLKPRIAMQLQAPPMREIYVHCRKAKSKPRWLLFPQHSLMLHAHLPTLKRLTIPIFSRVQKPLEQSSGFVFPNYNISRDVAGFGDFTHR